MAIGGEPPVRARLRYAPGAEITTALAEATAARLIALAARSDEPIRIVIDSAGGHVEAGDTIHDVIRFIRPEVRMIARETERNFWMTAGEAVEYGLVDRIVETARDV